MFICKSCLQRPGRLLINLEPPIGPFERLSSQSIASPLSISSTRGHATYASIRQTHHRKLLRDVFRGKIALLPPRTGETGPNRRLQRNDRAKEANKHHLDITKEGDEKELLTRYTANQGLQRELQWTGGDSLKLAKSVLAKLRASDVQSALELVRLSEKVTNYRGQKGVDSVVSWNHIMDYNMSKGLTKEAFGVFNEMKKRGHQPDAHTYTIMLRGYSRYHWKSRAVEEAMKVYDSIWRPESNIKPNTIHSNAIINCLGRALNMDALWSVAGRLPQRGSGAPDKWTYTTILNTMQACALRDARQLADVDGDMDAAAKLMQDTIGEGKRLWGDVISRWRSGDVNIDQTLVCAMGRLLLLGQRDDWDDVFSLVEQTMQVPRVKPPFIRHMSDDSEEFEKVLELPSSNQDDQSSGLEQLEMAVAEEAGPRLMNEFGFVDLSDRVPRGGRETEMESPYANIGNNVLSLLLEASINLREIPTGKAYWERLTNSQNEPRVLPDKDNLHGYLRLLRMSRSSREACEVLRKPVSGGLEGIWYTRATFILAMSTCARDFKNANVFKYASTLLDIMEANVKSPDLRVMIMYLSLAQITTPGISTEIGGKFPVRAGENNLIRAVQRFNHSELDYKLLVENWLDSHKAEPAYRDGGKVKFEGQKFTPSQVKLKQREVTHTAAELLEFLQDLNSAYDKLLKHRLLMTEIMAAAFTKQKRELSQTLQKLNPNPMPPSFERLEGEAGEEAMTDRELMRSGLELGDLERNGEEKSKTGRIVHLDRSHPFNPDRREYDKVSTRYKQGPKQGSNSMGFGHSIQEREPRWQSPRRRQSWNVSREDQAPQSPGFMTRLRNDGRSRGTEPRVSSLYVPASEGVDRQSDGAASASVSDGWGQAWKRSVAEMDTGGRDKEKEKDWVVM